MFFVTFLNCQKPVIQGLGSVAEHRLSKCGALGSTCSTLKINHKNPEIQHQDPREHLVREATLA